MYRKSRFAKKNTLAENSRVMKTYIAVAAIMLSATSFAQEWTSDLGEAISRASAENKKVLLFFTVPDACESCVELEEAIWKSEEFSKFDDHYVLARAAFNYNSHTSISATEKAENLLIVEKYNKDGFFPLVVILDKNARVMGSKGTYNGESPQTYLSALETIASN